MDLPDVYETILSRLNYSLTHTSRDCHDGHWGTVIDASVVRDRHSYLSSVMHTRAVFWPLSLEYCQTMNSSLLLPSTVLLRMVLDRES